MQNETGVLLFAICVWLCAAIFIVIGIWALCPKDTDAFLVRQYSQCDENPGCPPIQPGKRKDVDLIRCRYGFHWISLFWVSCSSGSFRFPLHAGRNSGADRYVWQNLSKISKSLTNPNFARADKQAVFVGSIYELSYGNCWRQILVMITAKFAVRFYL